MGARMDLPADIHPYMVKSFPDLRSFIHGSISSYLFAGFPLGAYILSLLHRLLGIGGRRSRGEGFMVDPGLLLSSSSGQTCYEMIQAVLKPPGFTIHPVLSSVPVQVRIWLRAWRQRIQVKMGMNALRGQWRRLHVLKIIRCIEWS